MPNPPYSASVIILREHQDGFTVDLYHYADMAETETVPPSGPIQHLLTRQRPGVAPVPTTVATRNAATRGALATLFGQFLTQKYPDTPA